VWFTKYGTTNNYINMVNGATSTTISTTTYNNVYTKPQAKITWTGVTNNNVGSIISSGTQTLENRTLPNSANATAANFVKVLNDTSAGWSPGANGTEDIFWSFQQNTTVLPDGWMTMHYVVTDHANNRSYYTQDMIVMNNYPKITNVTLYTNNTGEGAVFTTHPGNEAYSDYAIPDAPYASGYLNSGFISKNRVLGFGVNTVGGNGDLHSQARYVERYLVPLTKNNLIAMAGGGSGTRTLSYVPNDRTLNAQGVPVPTPPSTLPTTGDFVDLYTIATGNVGRLPGGAPVWKLLGVASPAVSDGSHFVFQGIYVTSPTDPRLNAENNVNNMGGTVGFPDVYVYAYKEIIGKSVQDRASPNQHTIPPESLNFSGGGASGDFYDTSHPTDSIPEAMATSIANATTGTGGDVGTAYFLIKVWDTVNGNPAPVGAPALTQKDMLYDAVVIGTRVFLNDKTNPKARLYDLNPYTEAAVTGNNIGTPNQNLTLANAAAPTDIGANIKRGGLYNIGTNQAPVKSGYIDPRSTSLALDPWVNYPSDPTLVNPYLGSRHEGPPNGFVTGDVVTGGAANDKVSGSVILRGLAWDDQLIDEIRVVIADTPKVILKLTEQTDGSKRMVAPGGVQAWAYEAIHWQTGHTVEWAYLWNTETEPSGRPTTGTPPSGGGPRDNVTVAVVVQDLNGRNPVGSTTRRTSAENDTEDSPTTPPAAEMCNKITVDIVPYVTGFERRYIPTGGSTPVYATKRSRQGWYSFYRGETDIVVNGYNLRTATDATEGLTMSITHSNAGFNGTTNTTIANTYNETLGRHVFTIPTGAASGRINIATKGDVADIYNHTSAHANKSWNRENSAYTAGSDLWVNKPHAHIWDTGGIGGTGAQYSIGSGNTSVGLDSPGMALGYASGGTLHGAWSVYGSEAFYYGTNTGSTSQSLYDGQGEPYSGPDISMYNGTDVPNVMVTFQGDGTPNIRLSTLMSSRNNPVAISNDGTAPTERWQNSRISKAFMNGNGTSNTNSGTSGYAGRVYMTSYDFLNKSLWFNVRYGNSTGYATTADSRIDGNGANITAATGSVTASNNAGQYSAVDYDSTGPIIAYYDQQHDTVRIAFNSTSTSSPYVGSWSRRYLLPETHVLRGGSGQYISMKVDRRNGIHLAFYNSSKFTVVYAYASSRSVLNATTPPTPSATLNYGTTDFYVCTIDNVVRGGQWTDISVDNRGNPMIVYGDSNRIGNYDGVRIAYRMADNPVAATADGNNNYAINAIKFTGALSCPITGADITGWEALTMPSNFRVNEDRLNIEVWPPTNRNNGSSGTGVTAADEGTMGTAPGWSAAVGYGSDRFRVGYFFYPTYKGY
jgi:hypothetical protein